MEVCIEYFVSRANFFKTRVVEAVKGTLFLIGGRGNKWDSTDPSTRQVPTNRNSVSNRLNLVPGHKTTDFI